MLLYQPDLAGINVIKNIDKYSEIIKYIKNNDSKDYSDNAFNDYTKNEKIKNNNRKNN